MSCGGVVLPRHVYGLDLRYAELLAENGPEAANFSSCRKDP